MNDPTILLPKTGSRLWPVTEYVFRNIGINYEPNSRKYRVDGGNAEFFLGNPKDWKTALEYGLVDASVTGFDLVVDDACRIEYVTPKRAMSIIDMLQKGIKEEPIEFIRRKLGFYETEKQIIIGALFVADEQKTYVQPAKPEYTFEDAKSLKGFPYSLLKLKAGRGNVVLFGEPEGSEWRFADIGVSTNYRNLAELWLDDNYKDSFGYRLVPFNGSVEGTNFNRVIDFMATGETAKANSRDAYRKMLDSQAVVATNAAQEELHGLLQKLFNNILES